MTDKIKIATTSLAGCFGCHMSILDIDDRILKLLEPVDFDKSPINDIKLSHRAEKNLERALDSLRHALVE